MQNNILYSVFTDNIVNDIDQIEKIKNFIQKTNHTIDFVVFTDEIIYRIPTYPILTTFYMVAYRGNVIFLTLDDFLQYKDSTNGYPVLFLSSDSLSTIDRNMIKQYSILTEENNQLKWIHNYEL